MKNEIKKRWMTKQEIQQMAEAALVAFEFACSWKRGFEAAAQFAVDEFGVSPTRAQAATAVRIAQAGWEGVSIAAKREASA
jgi:hypothetical protein